MPSGAAAIGDGEGCETDEEGDDDNPSAAGEPGEPMDGGLAPGGRGGTEFTEDLLVPVRPVPPNSFGGDDARGDDARLDSRCLSLSCIDNIASPSSSVATNFSFDCESICPGW
jgi:hypothetical protein